MFQHPGHALAFVIVCLTAANGFAQAYLPPREVKVLPVFFVAQGEQPPTREQTERLMRHLEWTRTRYQELLKDHGTFALAQKEPKIYRSTRELDFYRALPEAGAPQFASEFLDALNCNRYTCPYIFVTVVMNPKDDFPTGGGRPLNGGLNTGGGIVLLSSFALDHVPHFQSTLQHELGHAFGLPHVDAYGYDMTRSASLMSYNPAHHTDGFLPSSTPGELIPEDRRALALNKRVFPKLRFDTNKDIPRGYSLAPKIVCLGPMRIPGQPEGVKVTTTSGEIYGSKVANIVQGQILPSRKTGETTFDAKTMWHSAHAASGWVSVELTFPCEVELTQIRIHSQHSGQYHAAHAVRIARLIGTNKFRPVIETSLKSIDDALGLPKVKAQTWKLDFRAGPSGFVVLRGIQFYAGKDEIFPSLVPFPN
jgi:hypothetical protein